MVTRISVAMAAGALTVGTILSGVGAAPAAESTPTSFSATDKAGDVKIGKGARKKVPLKVLRSIDLRAVSLQQLDADRAKVTVTLKANPRGTARWARTVTLTGYNANGDGTSIRIQLADDPTLLDDEWVPWSASRLFVEDGFNVCTAEPKRTRTSISLIVPKRCGWGTVTHLDVDTALYRTDIQRDGTHPRGSRLSWDRAHYRPALQWQP